MDLTRDQWELVICLLFISWFFGAMFFVAASLHTRWHPITSLLWPISLPLVLSYELVNLVLLKIFAILAFCVWRGK